jgi:hypothetical protein
VTYWLAKESRILPSTLPVVQARAAAQSPATFGRLLGATPTTGELASAAAAARHALLTGVPDVDAPSDLAALVERSLRSARQSRIDAEDDGPWSAVFVVSCVRGVGIKLGLEGLTNGQHIGRETLLANTDEHREYTLAAYRARFGPNRHHGAFHAFRVYEREPQVGDIIVQDRRAGIKPDEVVAFDEIPERFITSFPTHGDIVVEVQIDQRYVVTIGGNVGDSVRRRRYPLDSNGRLIVSRTELYTQEDNSGSLPSLPVVDRGSALHGRSTRRIFAVLSPIPKCAAAPD